MGCGCGNRAARAARGGTIENGAFEFTAPDSETPQVYLTALEASRARRSAGGGTIRRVAAPPPASVSS